MAKRVRPAVDVGRDDETGEIGHAFAVHDAALQIVGVRNMAFQEHGNAFAVEVMPLISRFVTIFAKTDGRRFIIFIF